MNLLINRIGAKPLCVIVSTALIWTALAVQVGMFPALSAASLVLIGAAAITASAKFARRLLQDDPAKFLRVQHWISISLAISTLIIHFCQVFFGTAGGMFMPETGVTALATISASAVSASCSTRFLMGKFTIFHNIPSATIWLLTFSILNTALMLPSAILFASNL